MSSDKPLSGIGDRRLWCGPSRPAPVERPLRVPFPTLREEIVDEFSGCQRKLRSKASWGTRLSDEIAELFAEAAEFGEHFDGSDGDQERIVGIRICQHPGCDSVLWPRAKGDLCAKHAIHRQHPVRYCRQPGCGAVLSHTAKGDYCRSHWCLHLTRTLVLRYCQHPGCGRVLSPRAKGDRCFAHVARSKNPVRYCQHLGCHAVLSPGARLNYCGAHFKLHAEWRERHEAAIRTRSGNPKWRENLLCHLERLHSDPGVRARLREHLDKLNASSENRAKISAAMRAGYAAHPERQERLRQTARARSSNQKLGGATPGKN